MRKLAIIILIFVFLASFSVVFGAEDSSDDVVSDSILKKLKITGNFKMVTKYQEAFATPLDSPSFGVFERASANYRASENFRAVGNINFSLGKLGESKWFGVMQLKFDANDPDVEHEVGSNEKVEEIVELDNFFIMYRPFAVDGKRPFGVSVGVQTVVPTANAAYTHYFEGDVDEDFIFYTASGLTSVPMAQIDFHIDKNTGVGAALARGAGDITKIGTGMNENSALNKILWIEAKRWNFQMNSAIQFISGEGGGTDLTMTEEENRIYEYQGKYDHKIYNGSISYKMFGLKPYVGYTAVWGDEVPSEGQKARTISGNFTTMGINVDMEKIGFFGKLFADYTVSDTDKFDGLQGLPEGTLAQALSQSGNPSLEALAPTFTDYGGNSEVIYAISRFDNAYHFEYSINLRKNLKLSAFYYELMAKNDNTMSDQAVQEDIAQALQEEAGMDATTAAGVAAQIMAGGLSNQMDQIRKFSEWTHTYSVGMSLEYSF
ncbi:MAG: hypothetical protein FXF47_08865 [Candidatus Mcinerneyibacterium aminivorans]|uniref:Uncharacterized protein n=1 Tax=Candidatus Mcinerneyibacterium aminivorans TaxID=2703815 RepID=A0A5D0MGY2_9BACT|nr:MAG: hypothetical protein FXF47_08865 [Candidatus Mcinerneyibacterium aminivorans]